MAPSITRRLVLACLVPILLAAAGCLQTSLHPLIALQDGRFDDRLTGTWNCSATESWAVEKKEDIDKNQTTRYYRIEVKKGDEHGTLVGLLGRIGGRDFITLTVEDPSSNLPAIVARHT